MLHRITGLGLLLFILCLSGCKQTDSQPLPPESPSLKPSNTQLSKATYLGNEGVMIESSGKKVLFDPFFHNVFNTYQAVPETIREAIFSNQAPYDNIDAIFISHAHGDHFSAHDLVKYLDLHPNTHLVASQQAINQLTKDLMENTKQVHAIELAYQDAAQSDTVAGIKFDVVRIPHAGWPQRAEISNLVFRVTLSESVTVIHMGDADPNDEHFKPLINHWNQQSTDMAFPPYWFFLSGSGKFILSERINAKESVGVHVPVKIPDALKNSHETYFSRPGESINIK